MKLLLSALLLATTAPLLAQNQALNQEAARRASAQAALENDLVAHKVLLMDQAGCPLFLQSASVASAANFLPVDAKANSGGTLSLHFRNQSGKPIRNASITAHLRVKTNVYDLDAHPLDLRLTVSGTSDIDKTLDQFLRIVLPQHVYLFGVAQVSLDQVSFADGSVWTASGGQNACRTSGSAIDRVAK